MKKSWIRKNLLLVSTIVSVLVGVVLGLVLRPQKLSPAAVMYISFPGEILMNMLKMLILPLIISSVISGLAQLDTKQSGRIGSLAILYYFATTALAVLTGIILVLTIHPGDPQIRKESQVVSNDENVNTIDTLLDLVRNMFPDNIVQATFENVQTKYVTFRPEITFENDSATFDAWSRGAYDYSKPTLERNAGINVLGIIIFCIGFGIIVSQLSEEARIMIDFFSALDQVIMQLVSYVMWYSPIGIMCLITGKILSIDDMLGTVRMLALYVLTVMTGLAVHSLITLPLILFLCTRKNPFVFMKGLLQAWVTALGTASSSATLPMTFRCVEENLGIDKRVTRFVLPVGATINMVCFSMTTSDGTALYEAVAAIFIAQMNGIHLSMSQVITVSITATLASIGAAAVPSAGLVTMLLVLTSVGLPIQDVSLIVPVDWFLDRFRTSINVLGDAFGAGVVYHYVKDQLAAADAEVLRCQSNHNEIIPVINSQQVPQQKSRFVTTLANDGEKQTTITTNSRHVYEALPTSDTTNNEKDNRPFKFKLGINLPDIMQINSGRMTDGNWIQKMTTEARHALNALHVLLKEVEIKQRNSRRHVVDGIDIKNHQLRQST